MSSSLLSLTTAQRDLGMPGGATTELRKDGLTKSPVTYLDFMVDEQRLFERLNSMTHETFDYVGVIQDAWPVESVEALERLLGDQPGDLPDGRISLYVCPECHDLGCGAVTARLTMHADTVTWHDLAIQADYDDELHRLSETGEVTDVIFERASYVQALRPELTRLRPLAAGFEYPYQRERRQRRQRLADWFKGLTGRQ